MSSNFQKPKTNIQITIFIDWDTREKILAKMQANGTMKIGQTVRFYLLKGIECEKNHTQKDQAP